MIIACDLDRTLLPNGEWEDDGSLIKFYDFVRKNRNNILVYVSGRNLDLYKRAVDDYVIEVPDYFLGSVGTEVFINKDGILESDPEWDRYIKNKHPNWNRGHILQIISEKIIDQNNFCLQEDGLQNNYKISYYIKNINTKEKIVSTIENILLNEKINAKVIYSFDPLKKLGLVDVLPTHATKKGALEFLIKKLGKNKEDVVYSGDSGNDLLLIGSGIKTILVKNTPEEIKEVAQKLSKGNKLYIAKGGEYGNGYYSSGVLEGLKHYGVS